MFVHWSDPSVRLTGRWTFSGDPCKTECEYTATTAPGSYFEMAFMGEMALLHFELGLLESSRPHLWISVDGGANIEATLDHYIRICAEGEGPHTVKVLYKGGVEQLARWYPALLSVVCFKGADVLGPAELASDNRPLIEFIGDSITEGVLIDEDYAEVNVKPEDQLNRPYQDDNTATYAALTAKALNLRAMFQAYGATGMIRTGCGSVPRAGMTYDYVIDGVPYTGEKPDIVVINHGANDRGVPAEEYLSRYGEFLDIVRDRCPKATIVCLSAFCGAFDEELGAFIPKYNEEHNANVHFVSSKGWVPLEPLHPLRDGHKTIANHFAPILRKILAK